MAEKKFAGFFITQVHAVALAVRKVLAIFANAGFSPASVAVFLIAVLPHFSEIILFQLRITFSWWFMDSW